MDRKTTYSQGDKMIKLQDLLEQNNRILQEQERAMKHQMMQKEYQAKLQTDQYADKNKEIMSSFLLLHNK